MNAVNWFEIPATNFERAVTFYETILDANMHQESFDNQPNALFPHTRGEGIGGAIIPENEVQPLSAGAMVYMNAQTPDNLDQILSRVEAAGGTIVRPKTSLGPIGYIAMIRDVEGNLVGFHTRA
jgi:predicted enzyme related to lactoylglutathione lyase